MFNQIIDDLEKLFLPNKPTGAMSGNEETSGFRDSIT
jgi:hypothetical protein